MKDFIDLLGRVLLSAIFLWDAFDRIRHFDSTKVKMTSFGVVWQQDFLLYGSIIFVALGGLMLLIGYRTGLAVVLLLIYWIPFTFIVHPFWNFSGDFTQRIESIEFMKNMAIAGGLFMVFSNGSGRYSIKRMLATTRVR